MMKWLMALVLAALVLGGCSSSKTTGPGASSGEEGEAEAPDPAVVPEGEDPANFEEPDLTPGPSRCAGLAHAAIPAAPAEWDAVECDNPVPSNPCSLVGTQSRTYAMCIYVGAGGGGSCDAGGCECGELGHECVERTVVDERACDLAPPVAPLSAGPWGACEAPAETPCAAAGTQTRLELICDNGDPVEVTSAPQTCETELEGTILSEGAFSPTCDFLFDQADRTLCPGFEDAAACDERSDLCSWSGTSCTHTGTDEADRCVQSLTQERSLDVCQTGELVTVVDTRQCTRSTDGLSFDNRDLVACQPTLIDDCFSTGQRPNVQVSSCQGGLANLSAETLPCDLEPYTSGSYVLTSLADFRRYPEIGRPAESGHGLVINGAQFSSDVVGCRLTRIYGDLAITGAADQLIALSGLVEVTGNVTIRGDASAEVELPALRSVGGNVHVSELHWDNVDLGGLQEVGSADSPGDVTLSGGPGQLMELPLLALVYGSLEVTNNAELLRFDLPALSEVGGDFTIRGNDLLQAFEASNLSRIGGVLRLGGDDLKVCDAFAYVSVLLSRDALGDPCPEGENQTDVYTSDPVLPACIFFDELQLIDSAYTANASKIDRDGDFVVEACDNCPGVPNPRQLDADRDTPQGDECEPPP